MSEPKLNQKKSIDVDVQIPTEPPPGSYAETARFMSSMFPDFDWDAWKDEMKDRDY